MSSYIYIYLFINLFTYLVYLYDIHNGKTKTVLRFHDLLGKWVKTEATWSKASSCLDLQKAAEACVQEISQKLFGQIYPYKSTHLLDVIPVNLYGAYLEV